MDDYFDTFESCPACLGTGEIPGGEQCPFCGGSGNGLDIDLDEENTD